MGCDRRLSQLYIPCGPSFDGMFSNWKSRKPYVSLASYDGIKAVCHLDSYLDLVLQQDDL